MSKISYIEEIGSSKSFIVLVYLKSKQNHSLWLFIDASYIDFTLIGVLSLPYKYPGILRVKTIGDKLIFITNDDKYIYPFFRLKLLNEKFIHI